jgi:hypothetical protein
VLSVPCRYTQRHTTTYGEATKQHAEQAASTLPAGLATVCGSNDPSKQNRFVYTLSSKQANYHTETAIATAGAAIRTTEN